jgi:nitrogen-specific signal transduction histidine kinase
MVKRLNADEADAIEDAALREVRCWPLPDRVRIVLPDGTIDRLKNATEVSTHRKTCYSHLPEAARSVSDTGCGLPADQSESIFEPFFTTKARGTGMGLSISRRIVESHGDRLWANARPGRGTIFQFTLLTSPGS